MTYTPSTTGQRAHAIVIGGGIAGLVAVRVLANHFDRITLIERDQYPQDPTFRPGVPQGRQVHSTSLRGQQLLESLFPGLTTKLLAQGAIVQHYGSKSIYVYGRRCRPIPPVLQGWNCSRMLLEWQIRQELTHFTQVHVLEGVEVVHLLYEPQRGMVRGVQVRPRDQRGQGATENDANDQELEGDLVVDASGASSRILQWFQESSYELPEETVVDAHLGYATRIYEQPAYFDADWTGIAIQAADKTRRGGVLARVEGGRWMVVLAGIGEDAPSTNEEEYLAFAQRLPDPILYEAIKEAKPLSPIYGFRRTANRFRHFERLKRFPEHLVIIGDALCCFNPVYGQGMTVAVFEALALDECLKRYRTKKSWKGFSALYQRTVVRKIRGPWLLASSSDAPKKEKQSLAGRYMDRFMALATVDPKVLLTFLEVMHMLRSPLALLHPAMLIKVLTYRAQKRKDMTLDSKVEQARGIF